MITMRTTRMMYYHSCSWMSTLKIMRSMGYEHTWYLFEIGPI
ncbi:MAG: hypothetical protein PHT58_08765 [Eubacteriales bacterium]|nr:hypothetical protein [Eubacteriales bacterium]